MVKTLYMDAYRKIAKSEKFALPKAVAYCFRWNLLAVVFPRLCIIGFTFAQPFLITAAIQYLEAPDSTENKNHGYGLIGAAFLIYLGLAVMSLDRHITRYTKLHADLKSTLQSML